MKKFICFFTLIFVVVSVMSGCFFVPQKYVSVLDDKVYFEMSADSFLNKKGEPDNVIECSITPDTDYIYTEKFFDHECLSTYTFTDIDFIFKKTVLTAVKYEVKNVDYNDAKTYINKIVESFEKTYSKKDGFYNKGLTDNGSTSMSISIGTDDGAIGTSCEINYSGKKLNISVYDLF